MADAGLVEAVKASASRLGVDPSDILTAMSYETGGKLDPNLWGGKDNKYLGLIQFGPEERVKYGVKPGMAAADQVTAAENFLRDRGVKPGMGLLDIYSTINAGRPGLYDRSDAGNGGAPGTVADKVASMVGHRLRANAMLGVTNPAISETIASPNVTKPVANVTSAPLSLAPSAGGGAADADPAAMLAGLAAIPAALQQDQGIQAARLPEIRYFKPRAQAAQVLARAMQSGG